MEKVIILKKIKLAMKIFAPTFFNHFSLSLNGRKCLIMRAIREKLNIFTLQLSTSEKEISIGANADIANIR